MAMTKKEREAFEAAQKARDLALALRWTREVLPDVPPPTGGGETHGWTFNSHSKRVERAWSRATAHGSLPRLPGSCGIQGSLPLYSTQMRALAAMRHKLEMQFAADLLAVDEAIVKALQESAE